MKRTPDGPSFLRTYWPHIFGSTVVAAVGIPAGVASYRHGITIATENSTDPVMGGWLPMTTDGLLLAALVVLWVRRMTGRQTGVGPWSAFGLGLVATLGTNMAAAKMDNPILGVAVALWPPICLAIVLELVALIVVPDRGQTRPTADTTGQDDDREAVGPAVNQQKLTDDQILPKLREWVQRDGEVPGRKAVIDEYGVGAGRADRLRGLVSSPVRLVQTGETDDGQEATG